MKNEERRKAARRRWYYKTRESGAEVRTRLPDVPLLSAEERKTIGRESLSFARAKKQLKSEELQRKREERRCVICGGPVLVKSMKAKSCSKECAKVARRKRKDDWEKDCAYCSSKCRGTNKYCDECNSNLTYRKAQSSDSVTDSKALKAFLLRTRGCSCEGCGLDMWMNQPIPLETHHVDGNSENNKEDNLQLLCLNCHALTPTFRRKNKRASETRRRVRKTKEFAGLAQLAERLTCN